MFNKLKQDKELKLEHTESKRTFQWRERDCVKEPPLDQSSRHKEIKDSSEQKKKILLIKCT